MVGAFATLRRKLAAASDVAIDAGAAAAGEAAGIGVGKLVARAASGAARAAPLIGSVAGEAVSYAAQRAAGQKPPIGKALMSGAGGILGGTVGGIAGTAAGGPAGGVALGAGGSYAGNLFGEALYEGATGIARDTAAAVKNIKPLTQQLQQDPVPTPPPPARAPNTTPKIVPNLMAPTPSVAYVPPSAPGVSEFAKRVQSRAAAMGRRRPVSPVATPASPVGPPTVRGPEFVSPQARGPK